MVEDDATRARRVPVAVSAPAGPVHVEGDAGQLRRVVANLVDNAARHARTRVEVGVAARPDGRARLTVDDDGDGIAPPDRERVFERFARLDEGRARDQGGAGLGLAVVRSLVERHRGTVVVDESPAGGARVVVDLPPPRTNATTLRGSEAGRGAGRLAVRDPASARQTDTADRLVVSGSPEGMPEPSRYWGTTDDGCWRSRPRPARV